MKYVCLFFKLTISYDFDGIRIRKRLCRTKKDDKLKKRKSGKGADFVKKKRKKKMAAEHEISVCTFIYSINWFDCSRCVSDVL